MKRAPAGLVLALLVPACAPSGGTRSMPPMGSSSGAAASAVIPLESVFGAFFKDRRPGGYPIGQIVRGPDGNLWFADTSSIGRITPQGEQTKFAPSAAGNLIANGPAKSLWFTSFDSLGNPAISRITTSGSVTSLPIPSGVFVIALAGGADGNEWFADNGRDAIGKITTTGQLTEYPLPDAQNHMPAGITRGPGGNVWFLAVDFYGGSPEAGTMSASGTIAEYPLPVSCTQVTDSIVLGLDGNVWVSADCGGNAMVRITPSGRSTVYGVRYPMFEMTAGIGRELWGTFDRYIVPFDTMTQVQGQAILTPAVRGHRSSPWALAQAGDRMWLTINTGNRMAFIASYGAR